MSIPKDHALIQLFKQVDGYEGVKELWIDTKAESKPVLIYDDGDNVEVWTYAYYNVMFAASIIRKDKGFEVLIFSMNGKREDSLLTLAIMDTADKDSPYKEFGWKECRAFAQKFMECYD